MLDLPQPLSSAAIIILVVLEILSFLYALLVVVHFRTTIKSRTSFFNAVVGSKTQGMFSWCLFLLFSYIIAVLVFTIIVDLLFYFSPHLL